MLTTPRLISIEIMIEATERLAEGRETKRLTELFVVSSLGLAVNLVGMACFGHHGGAGHSHGGHSCGGHSHEKSDPHSHDHHLHDHQSHSHSNSNTPVSLDIVAPAPHSHGHSHENENMHGIFLHILADTMGSAAVIVSTLLILFLPGHWGGWDPVASFIIAILIFLSSVPLVKSSAQKLLLTIPADTEYQLRETLAGVSGLRGVASYSVPRFWIGDQTAEGKGAKGEEFVLGVMHVSATRGSELDDVRERTRAFLLGSGLDVVVQVEREGEGRCWCGGDVPGKSPTGSRFS